MAITTSSFTQELENALLAFLVAKPDDRYGLFDVVSKEVAPPGSIQGSKTIHVDQFNWTGSSGTFDESSRRLTDGTDISGTPVGMSAGQFTLTLREYGGPHDSSNVAPLGITELMLSIATHDLAAKIGPHLLRDYRRWKDAVCRDICLTSTSYMTGGSSPSSTNEGTVTSGQKATFAWLTEVAAMLKTNLAPAMPNGRYMGFISPRHTKELLQDSDVKQVFQGGGALRQDIPTINGYVGTLAGIDLFELTTIVTKGVGSGSAVTGYQAIFCGDRDGLPCCGHYDHLAVTPRVNKNDDYGRKYLTIWKEHAAYGALDVNTACVRGITT
jgi:hypothetical protein